jgi:hypothetical protein
MFAPTYLGVVVVSVPAIVIRLLNRDALERGLFLRPEVVRAEHAVVLLALATIPVMALALRALCARIAAPRATKRRYVRRRLAFQIGIVAVALALMSARRLEGEAPLASAIGAEGRTAYVERWDWGCGYRVRVSEGRWMMATLAEIGPFPCEMQAPHVEWRGREVALVGERGETFASWVAVR